MFPFLLPIHLSILYIFRLFHDFFSFLHSSCDIDLYEIPLDKTVDKWHKLKTQSQSGVRETVGK